jgi:hypothetical protein
MFAKGTLVPLFCGITILAQDSVALDALHTGQTAVNQKDGLTYVWIDPGTFMMGCTPGIAGDARNACSFMDESTPAHEVTITKGFWIGQTVVTLEAYQKVTGSYRRAVHNNPKLPAVGLSWHESQSYCQAVGMRLPTEAEWEYAARAGSTSAYIYGDIQEVKRGAWRDERGRIPEVMEKKPNTWGLYDLFGLVWQWTVDWYDRYPESSEVDPQGPASPSRCAFEPLKRDAILLGYHPPLQTTVDGVCVQPPPARHRKSVPLNPVRVVRGATQHVLSRHHVLSWPHDVYLPLRGYSFPEKTGTRVGIRCVGNSMFAQSPRDAEMR